MNCNNDSITYLKNDKTKDKRNSSVAKICAMVFTVLFIISSLITSGVFLIVNNGNKSNATTETTYLTTTNLFNTNGTINATAAIAILNAVGYYKYSATTTGYTAHNIAGRTSDNSGSTIIFPMGYVNGTSGASLYWQATYLYKNYITIWLTKCYVEMKWNSSSGKVTYDSYATSTIQTYINGTFWKLVTQNSSTLQSIFATPATVRYQTLKSGTKSDTSYYYNTYYEDEDYYDVDSQFDNMSTTVGNSHYMWLPSFGEVFNNTTSSFKSNTTSYIGQWGLNSTDRSFDKINYYGSTTTSASWLRSGQSEYNYSAMSVSSSGSESSGSITNTGVGLRPAAHLSLTKLEAALSSTVTLDQQGGSGGTSSVTVSSGSAMPSITIPTRTGYTFGGYYTGTNGSGTQYYNPSGTSARNWDLSGNITLYAKWTMINYAISTSVTPASSGSISGGGTYNYNTTVTLTATPNSDYLFSYWEIDGVISSATSTTLSFTATANTSIVAHFKLAKTYSYSTAGGEIRLTGNDFQGGTTSTTATYEAISYAGYYLIGWSINGEVYKPSGTIYKERTLTLSKADAQGYGVCAIFSTDANATPTPTFDLNTGTAISAQLGGEARAVGCDLSTLADTDTVTYFAVTDLGHNFDGWYIDGELVNSDLSCRLTKTQVLGKIVEAWFSLNSPLINDDTNNSDEIF